MKFFEPRLNYYYFTSTDCAKTLKTYYKNKVLFDRNLLNEHCCLSGMNFRQGISREQISIMRPLIASDNPVRVIDMFVDQLDLGEVART